MKKIVSMLLVSAISFGSFASVQCFAKETQVHNEVISNLSAENQEKLEAELVKNPEVLVVKAADEKDTKSSEKKNDSTMTKITAYVKDNKWWFIVPAVVGATQVLVLLSDKLLGGPMKYALKTANLSNEAVGKQVKILEDVCKDPLKRGRFEDYNNAVSWFGKLVSKLPFAKNAAPSIESAGFVVYPVYDTFRNDPAGFTAKVGAGAASGAVIGSKFGCTKIGAAIGGVITLALNVLSGK